MASPHLMTGLGAALSVFFSAVGASIASVPAGNFLLRSKSGGWVSFAPIPIARVLGIYGTIMAFLLYGKMNANNDDTSSLTTVDGYRNFTAGLTVGFACLASGFGLSGFVRSNMEAQTMTGSCKEQPLLLDEETTLIKHEYQAVEDGGCTSFSDILGCRSSSVMAKNHETNDQRGSDEQGQNLKFLSVLVFLEAIGLYGLVVGLLLVAN